MRAPMRVHHYKQSAMTEWDNERYRHTWCNRSFILNALPVNVLQPLFLVNPLVQSLQSGPFLKLIPLR